MIKEKGNSATKIKQKKRFFTSPIFLIFAAFIIFLVVFLSFLFKDEIVSEKEETVKQQQWNSDAKLIDDRLSEDYPIFFIVSPNIVNEYVNITFMCIYNDGKYVTAYYVTDILDTYLKESVSSSAFIDLLKNNYSDNINTEVANLLTDDLKPSDVRDIYLSQYDVEDFSLSQEVDLTNKGINTIEFYGITYNVDNFGKIVGNSHKYYSESDGITKKIIDETGLSIIEWIFSN